MSTLAVDADTTAIWMDGRSCAFGDASLHVLSHGLNNATCIFEGARAYGGRVFALGAHVERLERSARYFEMTLPCSARQIETATQELVDKCDAPDVYIRTLAWRGAERIGISAVGTVVHLAIAAIRWADPVPPQVREEGIRLSISNWRKPPPSAAPLTAKAACHYAMASLSADAARRAGFDDALFLDHEGNVAEATGANLFAVRQGVLWTPPAVHCLDGITRRSIIELARQAGMDVREAPLTLADLYAASEIFLTGTAMEVLPVRQFVDVVMPHAKPVTRQLSDAYRRLVREITA